MAPADLDRNVRRGAREAPSRSTFRPEWTPHEGPKGQPYVSPGHRPENYPHFQPVGKVDASEVPILQQFWSRLIGARQMRFPIHHIGGRQAEPTANRMFFLFFILSPLRESRCRLSEFDSHPITLPLRAEYFTREVVDVGNSQADGLGCHRAATLWLRILRRAACSFAGKL